MNEESKIITPRNITDKKITDYLVFAGEKLKQEALKKVQGKKCKKCHRKDKLKIVPLHESPHPMPSSIILYCGACRWNEVLMTQEKSSAMKYFMAEIQSMIGGPPEKDDEKTIKSPELVDKLIKKKSKKKK